MLDAELENAALEAELDQLRDAVDALDLAIAHLEQMPQGGVEYYTQEDLDAVPEGGVLEGDAAFDCAVRTRLELVKLRGRLSLGPQPDDELKCTMCQHYSADRRWSSDSGKSATSGEAQPSEPEKRTKNEEIMTEDQQIAARALLKMHERQRDDLQKFVASKLGVKQDQMLEMTLVELAEAAIETWQKEPPADGTR